ncbi:MAG: hypothetical protein AAGC93_26810 [Cyanobacteria bacterium P01_F01_bin.53]
MNFSIPYEQQQVQVPPEATQEVADLLVGMGLSLRLRTDGLLTAIIRLGRQGALDRLAITHAELRFSNNRPEIEQWLEMCWQLPLQL